jgi:hypothetical protein
MPSEEDVDGCKKPPRLSRPDSESLDTSRATTYRHEMTPGSVDVGLVTARAQGVMTGDGLVVLDRIALRKDWKPVGHATYWVDLVYSTSLNLFQVVRSWRWFNSGEAKWMDGCVGSGPTDDGANCAFLFEELTKNLLMRYVVDKRLATPESPARHMMFGSESPIEPQAAAAAIAPSEPPIRRKGTFDLW